MASRPPRQRNGIPDASLEAYLRGIDATPLLTAIEEKALAVRVQTGDSEARDHMVRANLRLVVSIARNFPPSGLSLQDLISEGNLGLLRAVETFDPGMNTRFSTYAAYWIRQSMKRAVINTAKTIRIPAYMAQLLSEWRRAAAQLQDKLGRPATDEEIALHLKLPRKKLAIVRKAIRVYNAMPQSGHADNEAVHDDLFAEEEKLTPPDELAQADELRQVLQLLEQMEPREAMVLRLRFGLDGEEPLTLLEIGERLSLTRERVRQIERQALRRLGERFQQES